MINKNISKYVQQLLPLLIIVLFGVSCSTNAEDEENFKFEGRFDSESMENQEAYSIKERNGFILVGTKSGLFAKQKSEDAWSRLIDEDVSVRAFETISKNEIVASMYFNDRDSVTIGRTTNFGETWLPYRNGFDPIFNSIPTIIEQSEKDEHTLYAGGSILRVAKSVNNAESWDIALGSWGGFGSIFFISNKGNELWAGGITAIFEPMLYKSSDQGNNWEKIHFPDNSTGTVRDVTIYNEKGKIVLAALGSSIHKSTDGGDAWVSVYDKADIFTFAKSIYESNIIYASGQNMNGTLFFAASHDFGDTWETIEFEESPAQVRVNDMTSVLEDGKEVLYFGTNKGVYSYTFME